MSRRDLWLLRRASLASGDDTRCRLLDALLSEALAPREDTIRPDTFIIAQELTAKRTGPCKVLTGSTMMGF